MGNFEILHTSLILGKTPISVYISRKSGITVAIAEAEGPIVKGFFCIVTETFDDDGIPHILEHTVYSGSKKYPYKRALDLLTKRCLGSEVYASSCADHICYSMETFGSEGFLTLMPIFFDHIFHPLLSEETFLTEVHHITGEGLDGGLVYNEMLDSDYEFFRLDLIVDKNIYPGRCGYSSHTSGATVNLRESVNMTKVREFHKKFHRPENLKIIITGQIKPEDIFKTLEKLEETVFTQEDREPFQRLWQSPPPPLIESKDVTLMYPSDDTKGVFSMAWRTASCVSDSYTTQAIDVLLNYLTYQATSPLRIELVNTEPYEHARITSDLNENSESCASITLDDVPLSKLPEVKIKLQTILKNILQNEDIDMKRIEENLKDKLANLVTHSNVFFLNVISSMIIPYMLYGTTEEEFQSLMNPQRELTKLLKEPKSFWLQLLKKYFVENKYVAIHGVPSKEEKVRLIKEEKERIDARIRKLTESGLREQADMLEKAIKFKEREPPMDMMTSVPTPSFDSIKFHEVFRYRTDLEQQSIIDLSETPIFTYFDNLNSNLVHISALLDTSTVPIELRSYLLLLLRVLMGSSIDRDGRIIPYEEFMAQFKRDVQYIMTSIGYCGQMDYFVCGDYSQICFITLNVETPKYEIGLSLLKESLYKTIFTAERIKAIALEMIANIETAGSTKVSYAVNGMWFSEDSNIIKSGELHQKKFLTDLIEKLDSDTNLILENMEKVRNILTKPSNTALYIAGNLDYLKNPVKPINEFLPSELGITKPQQKLNIMPDYKFLKSSDSSLNGCIIALNGSELSTCFCQATRSITSYTHPDLPALMLYLQYITENPKWKQMRTKEYFYQGEITVQVSKGLLYLIYREANNVIEAYKQTKEIVCKQLITKEWNDILLETAKNSLIVELIDNQTTIEDVIRMSVISYLNDMDYDYNRTFLNLIQKVTIEDLNRVGEKYVTPLFDVNQIKTAIVAESSEVTEIADGFKKMGLNLTVYSSLEESFLNTL